MFGYFSEKNLKKRINEIDNDIEERKRKLERINNLKDLNIDHNNLLLDIKKEIPDFNENEFIEYTQYIIPNIHHFFSNKETDKIKKYCSQELTKNVFEQKEKYRISKDFDKVNVQFVKIENCMKEGNEFYVKVYVSIIFYDETANNVYKKDFTDKYWNDIWIVTFKEKNRVEKNNQTKCPNCGAAMEYDPAKKLFNCNYCRNHMFITEINWEIVDIEVK